MTNKTLSGLCLLCILLSGCSYEILHYPDGKSSSSAQRQGSQSGIPASGIHRVKSGESLFSISFRYGLDYREVAKINRIAEPYIIYPNQKIRLTGSAPIVAKSKASDTASKPKTSSSNSSQTVTKSTAAKPVPVVTKSSNSSKPVSSWRWPVTGTVTKGFSNAGVSSKGIDIKGSKGALVKSAADGIVVYAGNGLIGYGNLVIVKHNDVYLSAYAYNERILVKEQQSVKSGDSLAVIGGKGSNKPVLHFEVRRDGQPIDPLKILPKQ
ncbi:peptidoglycan DD-metalloendopeptidase family protein [Marinomonas epiphytica]